MSTIVHTPLWAFVILGWLVVRGFYAGFDQEISVRRAAGLPLLMLGWSCWRITILMEHGLLALLCWGMAVCVVLAICLWLGYPRGWRLDSSAEKILMPGSWMPLLLMLVMYVAQFTSGALAAMHPLTPPPPWQLAGFSLVYGGVSGIFFARSIALWQLFATHRSVEGRV